MRLLFLAALLFTGTTVFAQQMPAFETNAENYIKQVSKLLNDTKRDDLNKLADNFAITFPKYNATYQQKIIAISNSMRDRKMLLVPYFIKFFQAVNDYHTSKLPAGILEDWLEIVPQIIANQKPGNNKQFEQYMDFSIDLFSQNALNSVASKTWKCSSNDYDLQYTNQVPSVKFSNTDLFAFVTGDTIMIKNTSGIYYPFEARWDGTKGEATFERSGLEPDNVFVTFKKYTIDCNKSDYSVDSVLLTYNPYIKNKLLGKFTDKLITNNVPETSTYPRFQSYVRFVNLDNLANNVKYEGGLSLEGSKLNGSGTPDQRAKFIISRYDGQVGCVVTSLNFSIKKFEDITSNQAEIKVYIGKDSIYHPGATFRYNMSTKKMHVERGDQGIKKSAFIDSYHQVDIYAEAFDWDLNESYMDYKMVVAGESTPAFIESSNYFDKVRLYKYQNVADYNIINVLKNYKEKNDTNRISTNDLARTININFTPETIRRTLYKLVEDGFIHYDDVNEIVTIRQKAIKYVLAEQKKVDYDVIKITSLKRDFNSRVDFKSYGMGIRGIKNIVLSDSSFVVIFPKRDSVTLMKNRDMNFDGMFFAGRADVYGKNFGFSYDGFNISLSHADTLLLNVPNGQIGKDGKPVLVPLHSCIQDVSGVIQIDGKLSKSGGKKHDWTFPSIKTSDKSYVYYDQKKTFNGVYDRKKFFFELKPFQLDSLYSFRPDKISFDGKLVSAGIFPDIENRIGIQKDLSLGFITKRTDIPLYGGKGKFTNSISLDNRGLRGNGDITFLSSLTKSEDIIFFPDSLNAQAQSFNMPKGPYGGVPFPKVSATDIYVHWKPYADSMEVKMKETPIQVFENNTRLKGTLVLRSKGLRGSGFLDWADANMKSGDIAFGANSMSADTADFSIKSIDSTKFALKTKNVNAKIDFDKREGDFISNTDDIATELPYNLYRTSINKFKWDMTRKQVTFFAPEGTESEFTSMHPQQDSLIFTGKSATYDLTNFILKVNQVPYISVVDAKVYADSNKVVIEPGAVMRTLNESTIIADTINEFHKFYNCTTDIYGKQNYKSKGTYDFVSANGVKQKIPFQEIGVFKDDNKKLRTYAKTIIDTSLKFNIIPKIQYQGKVEIKANYQPIKFDGYTKLMVQNPNIRVDWFSIKNEFTPDSTLIYYTDPENMYKKPVTTGIVFYSDSADLYTSFFNAKRSIKDRNIFIANGIVFYDEAQKEFIAGDKNKILQGDKRGNMFKYNDATGKVYGEGKMDFGLNFGLVDVKGAGTINTDVKKNEYILNLLMGISFNMDKDLLLMLGKSILNNNFSEEDVDYFSDEFQLSIPEFINPKNDKTFTTQMNKEGTFKRPEDSPFTIFLTDLKMVWDQESRSFRSIAPIGIAYVGTTSVNRVVQKAYLEFGYKKTGDFLSLYIPGDDDNWYYFFYQNNNMQIASGNRAFITALGAIDPDKRRTKSEDGKVYQYNVGSENKKNSFVARMELLMEPPKKK
jgi:hypothetical protein